MLQDIAVVTGGQVISDELGYDLKTAELSMLGSAHSVKISKENTIIVSGNGSEDEIKHRIGQIKKQIEDTTSDFDREKLRSAWPSCPAA